MSQDVTEAIVNVNGSDVITDGDGGFSFEFESKEDCRSTCNITQDQWCDNIEVGIRALHCVKDICIRTICQRAQVCEDISSEISDTGADFCPTVFDGWSCFNATASNTTASLPCPEFEHLSFHAKNLAHRKCGNGTWFDEELGKAHTDYTTCPDSSVFHVYDQVNKIYISGYTISIVFLFLATSIFLYFRRALRCLRNEIHTHLFIASILHNICWLMWYNAVIYRMDSVFDWNSAHFVACKVLHVALNYFMVATYMWMLCEGLYLFVVLIVTFVSEKRVKVALYCIGWLLPLVVIMLYAFSRYGLVDPKKNERDCWIDELRINWIYKVPCIASVIVNFVFLVWIVYILVSKFSSDSITDRKAIVKTAKAIGVLVPLFGLHNLLAAFKPDDNPEVRVVIEKVSAIAISFQGTVVAILFCLINSEVIQELKKFFGNRMDPINGPQSMAMTQYTYVRPNGQNSPGQNSTSPNQEYNNGTTGEAML